MRVLELYEQLLLEHNVVNTDAISEYVEQFAAHCRNENAAEWFRVTLARELAKDDQINVKMTATNVPRNAPEWLEVAMERGDDLRVFHEPSHLNTSFEHLVDYFNALSAQDDPVMKSRERLLKVTVENALRKAEEWTARAAKEAMKTEVKDMKEIMVDGSYRWLEPETLDALKRDGAILHQCTATGTYDDNFKRKNMRFFMLHDAGGHPHVCISVRSKKDGTVQSLDQVKGKQNLPPIGRYSAFCANFLNFLYGDTASSLVGNGDVQRAGIVAGENGKLTLITSSENNTAPTKIVFRIGNVRVYETEGQRFTVSGNYGSGSVAAGGGKDYWFNSHEGDLFKINVGANNRAYLGQHGHAIDRERMREYAQKFLNEYFQEAPPPLDSYYSSSTKNMLVHGDLKLRYNHLTKKYGMPQEVAEKLGEIEGYPMYLWGEEKHSHIDQSVWVYTPEDEETFCVIPHYGSELTDINWWKFSNFRDEDTAEIKEQQPLIAKILNFLKMPPATDMGDRQTWRRDMGLFYSLEGEQWGDLKDVCELIWEKDKTKLYRRHEVEKTVRYMLMVNSKLLCEIGGNAWIYTDASDFKDGLEEMTKKPLLAALNGCEELSQVMANKEIDEYDIFHSNDGKWVTRAKAGKVFHRFDDGYYYTLIDRPSGVQTYNLYDASNKPLFALTFKNEAFDRMPSSHQVLCEDRIRASRYVLWLFNHLEIEEVATVDGDVGYRRENTVNGFLWSMGMFYDTRSQGWKLVQDGKLVHDGNGYRAVNFRNRIFIIDNDDGCVGWFKKDGNRIADHHVFSGEGTRQFYLHLEDFINETHFYLPHPDRHDGYQMQEYRKHGFMYMNQGRGMQLSDVEKVWPTEKVLSLPKGYEWVRKAVDQRFHDYEKEDAIHGDRYSLCTPDGKSFMRAIFDGEYLDKLLFSSKDTFDSYNFTDKLKELKDGPQKKWFFALMEKLDKKLTPAQVREVGYFRTKDGSFKAMKGNKSLQGFFEGNIDFGDGHVFKYETHDKSWRLGIIDEHAEYVYDRFKVYLKVKLDDEGIESVHYLKKEIKRRPNEYMPYIHKLMKIFATVSGE